MLRFADNTERAALVTPAVGQRLFNAAFEVKNAEVGPVTGVSIRNVDLAPSVSEQHHVTMSLDSRDGIQGWSGNGSIRGTAPHSQVNAIMDLLVTTEIRRARSTVTEVANESLVDLGDVDRVDEFIIASDGALPLDEQDLSDRRFEALKAMTKARFPETQSATTEFDVDSYFEQRGISSLEELLSFYAQPNSSNKLSLVIETDGTLPSEIVNHRIVVAVRLAGAAIADLGSVIGDVRLSRNLISTTVEPAQPATGLASRGLPFLVVFDAAQLDDTDLPVPTGSTATTDEQLRTNRLDELNNRLASHGVAFTPLI